LIALVKNAGLFLIIGDDDSEGSVLGHSRGLPVLSEASRYPGMQAEEVFMTASQDGMVFASPIRCYISKSLTRLGDFVY
jgi:hypothetical protein